MKWLRTAVPLVLLGVPLAAAVLGPWVAVLLAVPTGRPYATGSPHALGTDGLGRDVLSQLLRGGGTTLLGSVAGAYLVGGAVGLVAASARRRWVDEALLRPADVLLAVPSLLLVSVVAVWWRAEVWAVAAVVAAVNAPAVARLVRAAALDAASSPVAEALALQGQPWWRVQLGHVGRAVLRPVAADVGTRITAAVYLIAAVNFLGLGLDPTSADWAVAVARNRSALALQPWAALAPAAMIVSFTVGVNLLWDSRLSRR
ncbi:MULTISPECIES: ABC transporter permease subunit [Actinosynnema]|uniref:ABC transporter permease n=1 Tax=Actinosynnema TaxID=40566 RepID=UPI0020A2A9BB|nr:ABC transporter permease subunit [Actinosynnema pretiosum]MCP2098790.1 peptide/nickel transport system permease protein [Actinosynnema pretiosum]